MHNFFNENASMKKIIQWFIEKSESRKITVIRTGMAAVLASFFWIFFFVFRTSLIDQENTHKFLEEQNWLKFIKSNIRDIIINRYGVFLLGVLVALAGYKIFKKPATQIVRKYFTSGIKFEIIFQSSFPSLPYPEFIFLLPGITYGCSIVLKNKSEELRINSIEVTAAVNKDVIVDHVKRNHITQTFSLLHFEADDNDKDEEGKGLTWSILKPESFKINEPFVMAPHDSLKLPELSPMCESADLSKLEEYVNNMFLEARFDIIVSANEKRYLSTIIAPLRILIWDEESLRVKGIDKMPEGSKNSRVDFERLAKDIEESDGEHRDIAIQVATREFQLEDIKKLKKELSLEPQNPDLNFELAKLYRDTLQYEEAMFFLNKALEFGMDSADFHYQRVLMGFMVGSSETKNSAERLLTLSPNDANSYVLMGQLLDIDEKPQEALKYFDKALTLDPNSSTGAYWKSRVLNEFENYKEGLEWLNKSISLDPEFIDSYIERAITLIQLKRPDEAVTSVAQAIEKGFNDLEWIKNIEASLEGDVRRKFAKLIAPLQKSV